MPSYFQIYLNGQPYQHSTSLGTNHLLFTAANSNPQVQPVTLPDRRLGRQIVMTFRPLVETDAPAVPSDALPECRIVAAQNSSELSNTLAHLRWLFLALCGGAMVLSGAALAAVTGRAIQPVRALARKIEYLHETELSTVLSAQDFPDELGPVVHRLNDLLARLAVAFARERAFTADFADEMRTLLAGIRATLQGARSRPRDAAAYQSAIDKSLTILDQTQTLAEKLLLLARADSGEIAVSPEPTDLSLLVQECMAACHDSAMTRGLQFNFIENLFPEMLVDRELLRIVLANLMDNAVSYAQPNTAISLGLALHESSAVLDVASEGHCLTDADLPEFLHRFVRKDASRSATGIHAGLGLSICQRLLALQSATLTLHLKADRFIARVQISLSNKVVEPVPLPHAFSS